MFISFLQQIVQAEGGYEDVTRLRRWSRVAALLNYTAPATSAILRRHYERILYPYDIFMSGAMTGGDVRYFCSAYHFYFLVHKIR